MSNTQSFKIIVPKNTNSEIKEFLEAFNKYSRLEQEYFLKEYYPNLQKLYKIKR